MTLEHSVLMTGNSVAIVFIESGHSVFRYYRNGKINKNGKCIGKFR